MAKDREGACLLFGFSAGSFYVTIAENGGQVTTWRFSVDTFLAGFGRACDAMRSYSSQMLHEIFRNDEIE